MLIIACGLRLLTVVLAVLGLQVGAPFTMRRPHEALLSKRTTHPTPRRFFQSVRTYCCTKHTVAAVSFQSPGRPFAFFVSVISFLVRNKLLFFVRCLFQRMDRRESTDFFYMGSIDTGGITQVRERETRRSASHFCSFR